MFNGFVRIVCFFLYLGLDYLSCILRDFDRRLELLSLEFSRVLWKGEFSWIKGIGFGEIGLRK